MALDVVGVDSAVVIGESVVVGFASVVVDATVATGSLDASGPLEALSDWVADPITMTAPRIQTQAGNLRNFFLNHFGLFTTAAGDEGGGGMLLIGQPFKNAYLRRIVEGTDNRVSSTRLIINGMRIRRELLIGQ
jgi:hypothetical protein